MNRRSAGLLLYRSTKEGLEVLLVHPGGPFWAKKDEGAWSIPKGEVEEGAGLLDTALREVEEELGFRPCGEFLELTPVRQAGGKTVFAWAVAGVWDPAGLRSNTFSLEWPRGSGKMREFPEVDRAAWFSLTEAHRKLLAGQRPILSELARRLGSAE